jgi:hypothetical protein
MAVGCWQSKNFAFFAYNLIEKTAQDDAPADIHETDKKIDLLIYIRKI